MLNNFIVNLLSLIDSQRIRYVHWKSNTNIIAALSNIDDLDILVHPEDEQAIKKVFSDSKIIRAFSVKDKWQPKIYHYIGFDTETGQLIHVHLHFGLVVGYDYDKNLDLPWVEAYLNNRTHFDKMVYLPQVEKEYIILVTRLIIKNALSAFLLYMPHIQLRIIKGASTGVIKGSGYREFQDLREKSDRAKLKHIIETEFNNVLPWESFVKYEDVILKNNSLKTYFNAARKLKAQLGAYKIKNELSSFCVSFLRLNNERLSRVAAKFARHKIKGTKTPEFGGRIIAFVGGDGAGKTTNVKALSDTLSKHFKTVYVHVGRPWKSPKGNLLRIIQKSAKIIGAANLSKALAHLIVAYDRQNAFYYALRQRDKGILVIQDRIPLKGITAMDCPRVLTIANGKFKKLAAREQKLYDTIKGIDLLYVLKLDPQIALQRRPEDDADELLIRSGQIWNNNWDAPYAFEVNTGEHTIDEIKKLVLNQAWGNITTPFVVTEIIGLNGSGKSSLLWALQASISNTTNYIPVRSYPFIYLKSAVLYSFKALFISTKLKHKHIGVGFIHLKVFLDVIKYKYLKGKKPATNFILDQGVIFQTVLGYKEGYISKNEASKILNIVSEWLPVVCFLEAPKDVLWERIQSRSVNLNYGRAPKMSKQEFDEFCEWYDKAFAILKESKLKIIYLDSHTNSTIQLHELIKHQIHIL